MNYHTFLVAALLPMHLWSTQEPTFSSYLSSIHKPIQKHIWDFCLAEPIKASTIWTLIDVFLKNHTISQDSAVLKSMVLLAQKRLSEFPLHQSGIYTAHPLISHMEPEHKRMIKEIMLQNFPQNNIHLLPFNNQYFHIVPLDPSVGIMVLTDDNKKPLIEVQKLVKEWFNQGASPIFLCPRSEYMQFKKPDGNFVDNFDKHCLVYNNMAVVPLYDLDVLSCDMLTILQLNTLAKYALFDKNRQDIQQEKRIKSEKNKDFNIMGQNFLKIIAHNLNELDPQSHKIDILLGHMSPYSHISFELKRLNESRKTCGLEPLPLPKYNSKNSKKCIIQ